MYVPAAQHSQAIIAWLTDIHSAIPRRGSYAVRNECRAHVRRLMGAKRRVHDPIEHRLLTPARADAWLREHIASEPTSLLHGKVAP
jgi:aminoglycoside phosphotransferase (APT) family kinase protein